MPAYYIGKTNPKANNTQRDFKQAVELSKGNDCPAQNKGYTVEIDKKK